MQKTVFYPLHLEAKAKMVNFSGWEMPINYGSQIKEHEAVRCDAGMFDVSHMAITDISGSGAKSFLQYLISNDVDKLEKHGYGKALYSAMLNEQGGVIDDLIVYYLSYGYRLVTNAGTYEKDLKWINTQAKKFDVVLTERKDLSMLAVGGPNAVQKVAELKPELSQQLLTLKPFASILSGDGILYARTGYTGEDGLEIMLPSVFAEKFWQKLLELNVVPCGLASRDTLRLEAGMNLYGHDMDENISPSACNMDWVVDIKNPDRNFIGKTAYLSQEKAQMRQIGVLMLGKGILREGQKIFSGGNEIGVITSGTFSPTLKISIAIARVVAPSSVVTGEVEIRGNYEDVKFINLPFVRNGKKVFSN